MRNLCAFLALALLVGASPAPVPQSADAQLAALAQDYFDYGFRTNPVAATATGVHTYDAQLGDISARQILAELAKDHDYLNRLGQIDHAALSADGRLDATLLEYQIKDDLLLNETLAQWRHNPDNYTQLASGAVFVVMSKDYAPLVTRMRYAIARERAIPAMLVQARKNVTTVDAVTKQISFLDASGSVDFFVHSVPLAFASVKDVGLQKQLRIANAGAAAALKSYAAWIGAIKPSGTYAIGADAYRQRLLYEDGLNISLDDYLAVGESALQQTRVQFIATAKKIDANASPLDVYLALAKDHPPADKLREVAQEDLIKLRAFVQDKHLVTLPPNANIKVIDTPAFERTTATAAEDSPGPLEKVATQAYYYVTPVDPTWSTKQKEDFLAQFNNAQFPIISAHEVYPGHFTNFSIERGLSLSLTRRLLTSSEFAEGWAHYDEQMVVDEGWGNGDPRVRLAQLEEALLRECRYVVGVGLHTRGMTIPAAEKVFTDQCFQRPQVALEETYRGTQDPMYGYYTLGKLMILKLRADYKKKLGADFTLQKFHDEFLSRGDPPIPLLRPLILGSADDGRPL